MFRLSISSIPAKYRIISFLVITSLVGVGLILIAVYNASHELEVINEFENLHRFASAHQGGDEAHNANHQHLLGLHAPDYKVLLVRGDEVLTEGLEGSGWDIQLPVLYESRVNERGGYMELDDQIVTWTMLPVTDDGTQLLFLHRFSSTGLAVLMQVYVKRLMVPAIFYIWLMVWVAFIVRSLTDKLSKQTQAMEHMALHDTLTGLPNRNLLADRLNKMLDVAKRKQSSFTLVMMDLDDFKKVNDTYGHAFGDALLKEVANRLKNCLRPHDTVCRIGGDEFILLLDDMQQGTSMDTCERVSAEVAKPIIIQDTQINIGTSIGVVSHTDYNDDAEALIHKADQAMYVAKAKGGGIVMYDEMSVDENAGPVRIRAVDDKRKLT